MYQINMYKIKDIINKIHCADCLEFMKQMPSKSVHLVLTDPPYGINYDKWDKLDLKWIKETSRILKEDGSIGCFHGWSFVEKVKKELEKYFILRNWIIWDRVKGRGAKYNFVSTREDILWLTKSNDYIFNKQSSNIEKKTKGMGLKNKDKYRKLSNIWTDISPIVPWSKERVSHPTQKPLKLIERIVKISSDENNIVFDPFLGSGTTALACQNLKRNFIGIDISSKYCEIARKRLKQKLLL